VSSYTFQLHKRWAGTKIGRKANADVSKTEGMLLKGLNITPRFIAA